MAYLDEHPPVRSQFRRPRRESLSGVIVVHTAENTPDYVAVDGGAEAVARFIEGRADAGSYHDLVDSDSAIDLVDYDAEAFHDATGSNPHSLGLSIATRADVWPLAPAAWREGAVEQAAIRAARMALHVKARTGVVVPPRRITRAESEARTPGFISHADRDPARRTDPGAEFPWGIFLSRFAALTGELTIPEDDMALTEQESQALHSINAGMGIALAALGRLDQWRHAEQANPDDDATEIARLVLAGLASTTLSERQVQVIVDAIPEQVKRALREGAG